MTDSGVDLRTALTRARRALEILEARAAAYTALTIPPELQIELEEKRIEVKNLEKRVDCLPPDPAVPLPPPPRLWQRCREWFSWIVNYSGWGGIGGLVALASCLLMVVIWQFPAFRFWETSTPTVLPTGTMMPAASPTVTIRPSLTLAVPPTLTAELLTPLYTWSNATGWHCWSVRSDPSTQRAFGLTITPTIQGLQFQVDFWTAAEQRGQVMYYASGANCPQLIIPAEATLTAVVKQLTLTEATIRAELFLQTAPQWDWVAGRPQTELVWGEWRTLRPVSWVTGLPPAPVTRTGHAPLITLGIEFNTGDTPPPTGTVEFLIERVMVTVP